MLLLREDRLLASSGKRFLQLVVRWTKCRIWL